MSIPDSWDDIDEIAPLPGSNVDNAFVRQFDDTDERNPTRPVLLVDWTTLSEGIVQKHDESAESLQWQRHFIGQISDFGSVSEELFERGIAHHTSFDTWSDAATIFEAMKEGSYYGFLDYPEVVSGKLTSRMNVAIQQETRWPVLNQLKQLVANCDRSIVWKASITIELEGLAIAQKVAATYCAEMAAAEPEPTNEMNFLDQVLAMVLSRTPCMDVGMSEDEHWQMLAEIHDDIRKKWIEEFLILPPNDLIS